MTTKTFTSLQDWWQLILICSNDTRKKNIIHLLGWVADSGRIWCLMVLLLATNGTHLRETPREQHWRCSTALNGFVVWFCHFGSWEFCHLVFSKVNLVRQGKTESPQGRGRQREKTEVIVWSIEVLRRIRTRLLPLIALAVYRSSCSGFVTVKQPLLWGKTDEQFSPIVSACFFFPVEIWGCDVQKSI